MALGHGMAEVGKHVRNTEPGSSPTAIHMPLLRSDCSYDRFIRLFLEGSDRSMFEKDPRTSKEGPDDQRTVANSSRERVPHLPSSHDEADLTKSLNEGARES